MTSEIQHNPLATAPRAARKSWREKRWERRRRRIWFEEILGWILVPVIVVALYWSLQSTLAFFGTTPEAVIGGIKALTSSAR